MHFSHQNDGNSTKVTKIAVVAVFHVVLAMLLIQSMNARMISMPTLPKDVVLLFTPELPPPPTPPEPPRPMPKVAPPQIVAPPPRVEVTQTPPPDTVAAIVTADPAPPAPTAPSEPEAPPAPASPRATPGTMRTAVLADGCAQPDYPAKAVRNHESGTVTLALLVGTDGRVAGSRVQSSSGSHELDKAAVAALSMCKFKPATNGGVAEHAWAQIAYVWKLD